MPFQTSPHAQSGVDDVVPPAQTPPQTTMSAPAFGNTPIARPSSTSLKGEALEARMKELGLTDHERAAVRGDIQRPDGEILAFDPAQPSPRTDGWTPDRQRRFVEALAEHGSVKTACRMVGMGRSSAYALRRRRDGEAFALAWDAAREQACHVLADSLMDRALNGQTDTIRDASGRITATRHRHDNSLGQWMLRHLDPVRFGALINADVSGLDVHFARRRSRFPALLNGLMRTRARALGALTRTRVQARPPARPPAHTR